MSYALILQGTYSTTEAGLYQKGQRIACLQTDKKASALLVPRLQKMFATHQVTVQSLDYIGVNQGPGPTTTLRVLLATVHGIAFVHATPLVGLDGLRIFLKEYTTTESPVTVALFNAYAHEAYYGIYVPGTPITTGYKNIDLLLEELKITFAQQMLRFIGSGTALFSENIQALLGTQAVIPEPLPLAPSLDMLAKQAHTAWLHQNTDIQLLPLYVKKLQYKKAIINL